MLGRIRTASVIAAELRQGFRMPHDSRESPAGAPTRCRANSVGAAAGRGSSVFARARSSSADTLRRDPASTSPRTVRHFAFVEARSKNASELCCGPFLLLNGGSDTVSPALEHVEVERVAGVGSTLGRRGPASARAAPRSNAAGVGRDARVTAGRECLQDHEMQVEVTLF